MSDTTSDTTRAATGDPAGEQDGGATRDLMVHLYRGQLGRAETWRQRLDSTTNWAVVLAATLLTWIFSSPDHPHYVLLIGIVGVTLFLFIEARRYRQYDIWRYRVRLLEKHLFAEDLEEREHHGRQWRKELSRDLRHVTAKIPFREALARRLCRVHLWILTLLLLAWALKIWAFAPEDVGLLDAMRIARIPGLAVLINVVTFTVCVYLIALWPIPRRAAGKIVEDGDYEPPAE